MNRLIDIVNNIRSAEKQLHLTISTYGTSNESLHELDAFILKGKADDYGTKLVLMLDTEFLAADSLVDNLIIHGRQYIEETRWSTTSMMYNIYLKVASYVYRENGNLQAAVRLKENASETNVTKELLSFEANINQTIAKLLQSVLN